VSASSFRSSLCCRGFFDRVRVFNSLAAHAGSLYVAWRFRALQPSSFSKTSLRRLVLNFGSFSSFNLPLTYSNSAATSWYGRTRRRPRSRPCLTDLKCDSTDAFVNRSVQCPHFLRVQYLVRRQQIGQHCLETWTTTSDTNASLLLLFESTAASGLNFQHALLRPRLL